MEKIRLGRTGMMVTRLGFGGIPIQRVSDDEAIAVVRRCLELGMNFIDTANAYTTSEERIGRAIVGQRQNIFLATKTLARKTEDIKAHLQLSLKRLGTDYIDLFQIHWVTDEKSLKKMLSPGGAMDYLEKEKKAGVIGHIGVTCHQIDVAKACVKTGRFETIMFPFNFIAREAADELLPLARQRDMGFIAMKPLAGGALDNATIAFKYLFRYKDVLPIPGLEKVEEIEEIAGLLDGPLEMTVAEEAEMQRMREELGNRFCRRCDYCQPCQQGINISSASTFPTFVKRMPPERLLSGWIAETMEKAGTCTECGECEERCPYNLPIREILAEGYQLYQKMKADWVKNNPDEDIV